MARDSTEPLFTNQAELEALCQRHHIRRLSLFGSRLRNEHGQDSDIDLLVEFDADHVPGLLRIAKIETELSALASGRAVDLRTESDLSRYFRDDVLRSAEPQYEA